ncbi:MAG: hypothetical protein A6D91_09230 [Bacillaceae bacterium G1]|nr:MAG: hypothetical protein A6D91_09230 [Bacillaceae bacterium G1]
MPGVIKQDRKIVLPSNTSDEELGRLLQEAVDSLNVGIVIVNKDGVIRYLNKPYCAGGRRRDYLFGRNWRLAL